LPHGWRLFHEPRGNASLTVDFCSLDDVSERIERLEVFVVADWSIDPERRLRRMKKGL